MDTAGSSLQRYSLDWRLLPVWASLIILALFAAGFLVNDWWRFGGDVEAYWEAAERLRAGELLYAAGPNLAEQYRYGPWFAYLWVPLTYLPREVVTFAWTAGMIGCWAACMRPLLRMDYASVATLLLIGPPLLFSATLGNVQAGIVALLLYGPWTLAVVVGGTLKGTPLVFGLVKPRRLPAILGLSALLMLPLLWTGLEGYPSDQTSWGWWAVSPWISVGLAVAGSVVVLLLRDRNLRLLAAGATACLAAPYLLLAYLAYLLVSVRAVHAEPLPN